MPSLRNYYIVSVDNSILALLLAPLARYEHAQVIPIIRENLDSVDFAIQTILKNSNKVESIKLLGVYGSFDNSEKELFSKTLVKQNGYF